MASDGLPHLKQADWNQTDENALSYIKNKPILISGQQGIQGIAGVNGISGKDGINAETINKETTIETKQTIIKPIFLITRTIEHWQDKFPEMARNRTIIKQRNIRR